MSFRQPFTIIRRAGRYEDGYWVDGFLDQLEIQASAQPLRPEEAESLPEGRRIEQAFKVYTNVGLMVADSASDQNADIIIINGEEFEIISVSPYRSGVINHFKAIAVRPILTREVES